MKNVAAKIAVFAGLAVASVSNAGVIIMQSQNFGPSTPNFTEALTFNKFDPALGTLLSVQVKLQLDVDGGLLQLDNDGVDAASGTANIGADATLTSMDVPLINAMLQPVVGTATAANNTAFNITGNDGDAEGTFEAGGTDYFEFEGVPATDTKMGFINPAFHGSYIGAAQTFSVSAVVGQIFDYGALGGISFAGFPVTASGNVMVTYDYEPVPAPGAGAIAAVGGLMLARRRRTR